MMRHAVITGGAGFIGSHLAEHLLQNGYRVTVVDNFLTGARENVSQLEENHAFQLIEADVTDEATGQWLVGADEIYHLAASVGVKHIMGNLVGSMLNNVDGTARVLAAAAEKKARVLVVSSSEVYGRSTDKPSVESDDLRMGEPIKTRWSYACSKALDEYLALAYWHEQKLPVTVVRLFNTVGDRQSSAYGMVLPTFVRQALRQEPLTIHGDGKQSRCFIYVKDVVKAMRELMQNDGTLGQVYNIGSREVVTIDELADMVLAATNSQSEKQYISYEDAYQSGFDDAYRREPDITKISQKIGFTPSYSLAEIISTVIEYEKANYERTR